MWEVVIWLTGNKNVRKSFQDRAEAYQWANDWPHPYAVEVYGPNGEYEGS